MVQGRTYVNVCYGDNASAKFNLAPHIPVVPLNVLRALHGLVRDRIAKMQRPSSLICKAPSAESLMPRIVSQQLNLTDLTRGISDPHYSRP